MGGARPCAPSTRAWRQAQGPPAPPHTHTLAGYDAFSVDVTAGMKSSSNELILAVYDPSDEGYQVNGKQRISAIPSPGGDTYTPSSGIWQTVWLENVPETCAWGRAGAGGGGQRALLRGSV